MLKRQNKKDLKKDLIITCTTYLPHEKAKHFLFNFGNNLKSLTTSNQVAMLNYDVDWNHPEAVNDFFKQAQNNSGDIPAIPGFLGTIWTNLCSKALRKVSNLAVICPGIWFIKHREFIADGFAVFLKDGNLSQKDILEFLSESMVNAGYRDDPARDFITHPSSRRRLQFIEQVLTLMGKNTSRAIE